MAYPQNVNFRHLSATPGMQPISETSTTQKHPLGMVVRAFDDTYGEGSFVYLKGAASTDPGDLVAYDTKTADTVRCTAAAAGSGPVAVAMSANVASQYGWYQVEGAGPVKSATVADNGVVYLTATAGQVDDVVNPGYLVSGARFKSASATGVSAWTTGTLYSVGTLVTNDTGKVYVCTVPGRAAPAWVASRVVKVGEWCTNDTGKLYKVITAGTTHTSGGPTGTDADITDGTAHWEYSAAAGGPTGTGTDFVDNNSVHWDYYLSAANNQVFATMQMNRPCVVQGDAGATQLYTITLSAAAEAGNAIVVTGTVKNADGSAVGAATQVVVRTLAITDNKGDITVTAGTEKKTVNPATGENVSWIETTAAGGFAVSVANDVAEGTVVTASTHTGATAALKLTFT